MTKLCSVTGKACYCGSDYSCNAPHMDRFRNHLYEALGHLERKIEVEVAVGMINSRKHPLPELRQADRDIRRVLRETDEIS